MVEDGERMVGGWWEDGGRMMGGWWEDGERMVKGWWKDSGRGLKAVIITQALQQLLDSLPWKQKRAKE